MNLIVAAAQLILALALLILCTGIGLRVLAHWFPGELGARELFLASLGVGVGLVGTIILVAGLLGLTTGWGLTFTLAAIAVAGRRSFRQLPELAKRAWKETIDSWGHLEFGIFGVLAAFIVAHAALPVTNYDSLFYHLSIPEIYLREGGVFLPPNNLHAAYVGAVHMLYLPLLALDASMAPAMLNSVLAILLIPLVQMLGEQFWDERTGRLAAVLIWAAPVVVLVGVTPRVDVTLAWYLLLAHYFVLRALAMPQRLDLLSLGALLLGTALAVKLSASLYILGLSPLIVWAVLKGEGEMAPRIFTLGRICALALAVSTPWLAKNWLWLGDPLYPFLGGKIVPAWLEAVYAGQVPPTEVATPAILQIRAPFDFSSFFFDPKRLTPEREGILYFANPALLLLPLTLLDPRWRQKFWLALPPLIYGGILLFMSSRGTNLRYLIPVVLPLTVVAAAGINRIPWRSTYSLVIGVLLIPLVFSLVLWSRGQAAWPYLSGELSREEYLSAKSNGEMVRFLNREVSDDGRVLLLFDGRLLGIEAPAIPDPPGPTNWLRLAPAASEGCLEGAEITHIVVSDVLLRYQVSRGLDLSSIRWDEFASFARRCLELIEEGGSYRVYRMR